MRRVLSEERGKAAHGAQRAISILDDVNLLSPQARTNLPLPLGPLKASLVGVGVGGRFIQDEEEGEGLFTSASQVPAKNVKTTTLRRETHPYLSMVLPENTSRVGPEMTDWDLWVMKGDLRSTTKPFPARAMF